MPELELRCQDFGGDSSGLEGWSNAAQSCLNAWLKEGGKTEKSRVWKLRVSAESVVEFCSEAEVGDWRKTHSGGGDHALYHSISLSTSSSIISGDLSVYRV